jgi:Putative Actinobacterial Holin-X, holin superfamily III
MNSLTRNLNILWRSERLLAEAEWRRSSRQITILVLAGVFGLLALIMLNVAGFYWLATTYGNAQAALAVAAADIVIAAILAVSAQSLKAAPETDMVREFRDSALAEIETEAEAFQTQLVQIRDDVKTIGTTVSKVAADPIGSLSPALLVPAINAFTTVVRSKKK